MNRRAFILGLLSSAAVPAVVKALPALPQIAQGNTIRTGLPTIHWRLLYQGIPIREVESLEEITNHFGTYGHVEVETFVDMLHQGNEKLKDMGIFAGPYDEEDESDYD